MDVDESGKDISGDSENESDNEEHNSSEDSEEESDDDENEDGREALSDEDDEGAEALSDDDENEDGTEALSDEDDALSDDDDGTEAANTITDDKDPDKVGDLPVSDLDDPDMSCPICLNEFVGQDLGSPENCSHTFCLECIIEWSKNVNTCPIDRIEFHLIYVKQEISGNVIKKLKVKVLKKEEEYVEEVTLCEVCRLGDREDRLLLCDSCDSGYHCECLDPPLETIPIEEWFCPPCSRVINQRDGTHSSHSRLIARTSASEIVRSRIQNHRTANSEDSSSEAVQQPRNVHTPKRSPVKRKTVKRRKKRRTTRKSSKSKTTKARTKATCATGKSKGKKGATKTLSKRKRKTKGRRRKTKKKSRRSWLASMKLVAPSVKKRIADYLGLCKPPPGHTMPYVKKSSSQHSNFVEPLPSVDVVGCHDLLFDFEESYTDDNLDDPRPSTSKPSNKPSVSRKPITIASTSGINLLDNILETQNVLLQSSKNITIGKDGSLNVKEDLCLKAKCEVKNVNSETRNEKSVLEQDRRKTLADVIKEKDEVSLSSSFGSEHKTNGTSAVVSFVNVKREKRSRSSDPPSMRTKSVKLDNTPPLSSVSSYHVKKERNHLQSHGRLNDVDTIFRTGDCMSSDIHEQAGETAQLSSLVQKEGYMSSSSRSEKEGVQPSESSVGIKKENVYHVPSNPVVNLRTVQSSMSSTSLFSTNNEYDKIGSSPKGEPSPKNHCQRNSKPLCAKAEKCSEASYDRTKNDLKRHLPFLSNGMNSSFKIPKLSKRTSESSVSETISSEISDKHLCTKVSIKSENVIKNTKVSIKSENVIKNTKVSIKSENVIKNTKASIKSENVIKNNLSAKSVLRNGTLQCDSKPQNMREKHSVMEYTSSLGRAVGDTDLCADQNENGHSIALTTNVIGSDLLYASKRKNACALRDNSGKNNVKVKSSLLSLSSPSNGMDNFSDSCEYPLDDICGSEKLSSSQVNCFSANSNGNHSVRESQEYVASSLPKAVSAENSEQEHLLCIDGSEQGQDHKTSAGTVPQRNGKHTEHKAFNKETEKVVSKHKLKESIAAEIKKHLKDFYLTDLITKDEYKEIMRRAVPKVFQNCGNSIDSEKIRKLVVSYVQLIGNTQTGCS